VNADEGSTIRCEVRATNDYGTSSYVASSNSSLCGAVPVNTVAPVISGNTTLGSTLTTTNGTWTGTATITFGYQWKRNGSNINGATNSTYVLAVADSAASITCQVTGTNSIGTGNATSNTITAANYAPSNTVAPTLTPSGSQVTGTVITLGNGTWTGASPITYEYRWLRDNVVISGETANTYTILAGDDGTVIKGQVKGVNVVGESVYITTSNQVDAVDVPPFVGILDTYPNAAGAYSLRKLRDAYSGSAIRVRRASDNAEQDIGFVSNVLDTASLTTFCSGTNGFITTWYDQSGNANNAVQTTANNQPQIVSSGSIIIEGTKPTLSFDNTDGFVLANQITLNDFTVLWVSKRATNTGDNGMVITGTGAGTWMSDDVNGEGNPHINADSRVTSLITSNTSAANLETTYHLAYGNRRNGTEAVGQFNNSNNNYNNSVSSAVMELVRISKYNVGDIQYDYVGIMQEIIIYASDKSSDRAGLSDNINTYYDIY
jgi:hypothetical protein